MLDTTRNDITIGVIGAGLMGSGIAQIAAQAGLSVLLYDKRPQAGAQSLKNIEKMLHKLADKGKISAEEVTKSKAKLQVVETLEALSACDLVIEAIIEHLDLKKELFTQLDKITRPDCILASNTSSLSVTAIAAACRRPERVAGYHFFSPVPLMKLVEIIATPLTESWVSQSLSSLANRMGHTPVHVKDTPGFIVNHAGRGFGTEALRILGESVADVSTIDRILRDAGHFRMGAFELLDLIGLDVSQPVMESIYHQYYQEPRFRPSPIARQQLDAGLLGRKSGRGFFNYDDSGKMQLTTETTPAIKGNTPIWLSHRNDTHRTEVLNLLEALKVPLDEGASPSEQSICLLLPLGEDTASSAVIEQLEPSRCIALDPLALRGRRTLMRNLLTSDETTRTAHALLASDGTPVSVINDSNGFVLQRVWAMIVNIACDMAQQGIATPADIDLAVKLGLGYPQGPFELGDHLGATTIIKILDTIYSSCRDPRYRPSPWLKRRASLSVSLLTPDYPNN